MKVWGGWLDDHAATTEARPESPYAHVTREQWAWFAGLFEGEGWVKFDNGASRHTVGLGIKMTDRDILERVDALFPSPSGIRLARPADGRCRAQYIWCVGKGHLVREIIQGILPRMGHRRTARLEEALVRLQGNKGRTRMNGKCYKGHLLTEENSYHTSNGYTQCRQCNREASHRRREARRNA